MSLHYVQVLMYPNYCRLQPFLCACYIAILYLQRLVTSKTHSKNGTMELKTLFKNKCKINNKG